MHDADQTSDIGTNAFEQTTNGYLIIDIENQLNPPVCQEHGYLMLGSEGFQNVLGSMGKKLFQTHILLLSNR